MMDGDHITHTRCRSAGQSDFRTGLQRVVENEVGADVDAEGDGVLAGFGDQYRHQPRLPVTASGGIDDTDHGVGVTTVDAVVVEVGIDGRGAAVP